MCLTCVDCLHVFHLCRVCIYSPAFRFVPCCVFNVLTSFPRLVHVPYFHHAVFLDSCDFCIFGFSCRAQRFLFIIKYLSFVTWPRRWSLHLGPHHHQPPPNVTVGGKTERSLKQRLSTMKMSSCCISGAKKNKKLKTLTWSFITFQPLPVVNNFCLTLAIERKNSLGGRVY